MTQSGWRIVSLLIISHFQNWACLSRSAIVWSFLTLINFFLNVMVGRKWEKKSPISSLPQYGQTHGNPWAYGVLQERCELSWTQIWISHSVEDKAADQKRKFKWPQLKAESVIKQRYHMIPSDFLESCPGLLFLQKALLICEKLKYLKVTF